MKKVLVKIFDTKYIPGVGKGPFIDPPVAISQSTLRNLVLAGIKLIVVDKKNIEKVNNVETPVDPIVADDEVVADVEDETVTEETTADVEDTEVEEDETVTDEETDEIVSDEEDSEIEEDETDETVGEDVEFEEGTPEEEESEAGNEEDVPDYDSLTVKELKALLDEHNVDYPNNALKADLVDLAKKI